MTTLFHLWSGESFALREGDKAPKFILPTARGQKIDISKYAKSKSKKNLLLVFFRTGNCGVCRAQLEEIAGHTEDLLLFNAAVLAISMDDAIVQLKVSEAIGGRYPVLMDPEGKATKAYGVFNPDEKLARPSIFLIAPDQTILYEHVGMSLADRPPFLTVLNMVRHYSGLVPTKDDRAVTSK